MHIFSVSAYFENKRRPSGALVYCGATGSIKGLYKSLVDH